MARSLTPWGYVDRDNPSVQDNWTMMDLTKPKKKRSVFPLWVAQDLASVGKTIGRTYLSEATKEWLKKHGAAIGRPDTMKTPDRVEPEEVSKIVGAILVTQMKAVPEKGGV